MKTITPVLFLLIVACVTSCVNRIAIPEDEESKLFINLEMLRGETEVVADFKTTNNLNGSYPIDIPQNALIHVEELNPQKSDENNEIDFVYDDDLEKYVSNTGIILRSGRRYQLDAIIENSIYKDISSTTVVPYSIEITDFDLISEGIVKDEDDNDVWQGVIGIEFLPSNALGENFGHLQIHGFDTELIISPDEEPEYFRGNEKRFFDLIDVHVGYTAVTDLVHKDGFFVDFDKLEDNYIEIEIRSKFPITKATQVTDMLMTDMMSVSKEHYKYHISYHNIKQSQGNIFEEDALYISNIDNGLGLFSSCINLSKTLELRK